MTNVLRALVMGITTKSFQEASLYAAAISFYGIIIFRYVGWEWMSFITEFRIILLTIYIAGVIDYYKNN